VETIAITGTAANISCIAGGIIVFGDPVPGSAIGIALQAVAFVMIIVASALTPAPAVARDGGSTSGRPLPPLSGRVGRTDAASLCSGLAGFVVCRVLQVQ
jgi:hypothetical protein